MDLWTDLDESRLAGTAVADYASFTFPIALRVIVARHECADA
jgi:hypothetical protein